MRRWPTMVLAAQVTLLACGIAWATDNTLAPEDEREGWRLLFDGRTTTGWMGIDQKPLPQSQVQEGSLNPHPCDYMLVYEKPLTNFELALDFKISPHCNSGIFFRTNSLTPKPGYDVGFNGIEIAIDDTQEAGFHDTGALYDLVRPRTNAMKPVGEWNHFELSVRDSLVRIDVNGERVTEADFDEFSEPGHRPDGSEHKFTFIAYKDHPRSGYIGLQDHGSDCWYKNIRLRELK